MLSKNKRYILLCVFVVVGRAANADVARGKALFVERCATCHGSEGAGDGPVAASLPPELKPRNLKEFKVKYATDDVKFKELLMKGGAAVGLNAMMPPQTGLGDADLDSIVQYVHTLKK